MCFENVADAGPIGPFCPSSDSVTHDQRGSLQRLGMSFAYIGFDKIGASGEEPPEEVKGFGPVEGR